MLDITNDNKNMQKSGIIFVEKTLYNIKTWDIILDKNSGLC